MGNHWGAGGDILLITQRQGGKNIDWINPKNIATVSGLITRSTRLKDLANLLGINVLALSRAMVKYMPNEHRAMTHVPYSFWTSKVGAEMLNNALSSRKTLKQISNELDVQQYEVRYLIKSHSPSYKWLPSSWLIPQAKINAVMAMVSDGVKLVTIGARTGFGEDKVSRISGNWHKKHGLKRMRTVDFIRSKLIKELISNESQDNTTKI